jgi:hypothetical protein
MNLSKRRATRGNTKAVAIGVHSQRVRPAADQRQGIDIFFLMRQAWHDARKINCDPGGPSYPPPHVSELEKA